MSGFHVRFTEAAQAELLALYGALLERDTDEASYGLYAVRDALRVLEHAPASCRLAAGAPAHAPLRELPIPLGEGCVALFAIDDETTVTVLAVRPDGADPRA